MQNKAIFLCGPTAVGKTALGLQLAQYFPIEIISVDSALIYQDLNIGSAKPSCDELSLVPHHLINILSPLENYSVMEFLRDCNKLVVEITARGRTPVLLGGTMMYYNALINGISQLPEADSSLRAKLDTEFSQFGNQYMHDKLRILDAVSANKIEINDIQRVQRALEVCILTGKPMSVAQQEYKLPGLISCEYLPMAILPDDRSILHERINLRFDLMMQNGFIDEVQILQQKYPKLTREHNSMRCVGYRQVWDYLDGTIDFATMLDTGKAATRQLAKRQMTWIRGMKWEIISDINLNMQALEQKMLKKVNAFLK